MIRPEIEKLEYLSVTIPRLMRQIDEHSFSFKPAENVRSKKEIVGHLIDTATNNHQSLASFQHFHGLPVFYDLHNWNKFGYYRHCSQPQIIALWESSNLQLMEIIRSLQEVDLKREYLVGAKLMTVRSLIRKYIKDLETQLTDVLASGLTTESRILTSPVSPADINEIMMVV